jgi:Fe-S-cluster containining protein
MICALCDARCCKTYIITVTAMDVVRIADYTSLEPESFAEFYEGEIENQDPATVVRYRGGKGRGVLALRSQPCIFLKNNRCSIYEVAPLTCKLYPKTITGEVRGICPPHAKLISNSKSCSCNFISISRPNSSTSCSDSIFTS